MPQAKSKKFKYYFKWFLWAVLIQFILVNVSASIYAYKFTHFYDPPAPAISSRNIFDKTWKLFTGPKFYKNTNLAEPSFAYQNIQLKTSDGIPIDAWYGAGGPSSACVILVHGYSVNKSYMLNEAAMFRQWGYSVLLFDLRGHGKSGGSTTSFGMKETDELEMAYRFAREKGHSKILLYGVSMGSAICFKAVAEGKVQPAGIIADVPFESLHHLLKVKTRLEGFPSEPFASLVTFWTGVERGYNSFQYRISSYAKKVSCPVLMEWGVHDGFVNRDDTEKIFNSLASKNKKLAIYPNAGHGAFLQHDALTWEKEIQAFLKSVQ